MERRQEGHLDLIGMLTVAVSALAVVLVIVAILTDRMVLLAVAAVAAAVAVLLVVRQRASGPHPAPTSEPGPDPRRPTPTHVAPHDPDGDQVEALQYQVEAVTARADLLATLRHGFRADATRLPGPDDPSPAPSNADTTPDPPDPPASPAVETDGGIGDGSGPDDRSPRTDRDPLFDPDTGLFTQDFFEASLPKRVSAARRGLRPLSVAAVTVVAGRPADRAPTADPTVVAEAMTEVFRDADTIAVTDDGLFLVLLEDTPEAGAVWTLERLRRRLADADADRTMWAGVSCYPAYSFDADGLISQARAALDAARQWQQDRIEISTHTPE